MRQRAKKAEVILRIEQDAFEEAKEWLNDDLSRVLIAQDKTETHKQEAIADCQQALKVFKFKKYKEGFEDGKCEVSPR